MPYEIRKEERAATTALVVSRWIPAAAVAEVLGEMLPQVFEYVMSHELTVTAPPFAMYTESSAEGVTLTGGMPVADPGDGTDQIRPITIPSGTYAKTIHAGAYDTLNEAHQALEGWILGAGFKPGPASYEFYLTDPGEYPDEADWRTEVLRGISS